MRRTRVDLWLLPLLSLALIVCSWRRWLPLDLTETLGFVTGVACVYLVVKENIWNFPLGIANNLFFLVLFTEARLFADAGLQIVYLVHLASPLLRPPLAGGGTNCPGSPPSKFVSIDRCQHTFRAGRHARRRSHSPMDASHLSRRIVRLAAPLCFSFRFLSRTIEQGR
jgi:hypothetical protein